MGPRAMDIPDLGFQAGDHVCAFYSGGSASLHDVVVDFVSRGLRAGNKCVCFIDTPSSVRDGPDGWPKLVPWRPFFFRGLPDARREGKARLARAGRTD